MLQVRLSSLVLLAVLSMPVVPADSAEHQPEPLIILEQPALVTPGLGDLDAETRVRFSVLRPAPSPAANPAPVLVWVEKPSCGCITAAVNQEQYVPGQGGCIDVQFVIGQYEGLHQVHLIVHAAHPGAMTGQQTEHLDVRLQLPSIISVTPRSLVWQAGDADDVVKTMTFTAVHPGTVLTTWDGIDAAFALVQDRCVRTATTVTLAFRRVVTNRRTACSVHMHADVGGGHMREGLAFLASNVVAPTPQH